MPLDEQKESEPALSLSMVSTQNQHPTAQGSLPAQNPGWCRQEPASTFHCPAGTRRAGTASAAAAA